MNTPDKPAPIHLLLVDDDRLVLSTLSVGLRHAGYRVSTAESSEEAEVQLADGMRPDLAIVDIRMSGEDGLYLAHRLRKLDHIPFIMFSAYSEQHMIGHASHLGALGYLVKPLDVSQLLPTIEAALARANELQDLRETRARLQAALDTEREISMAIGITMARQQLPRQQAFELLRKTACSQRRKLTELADEIIRGKYALDSPPDIFSD